MLRRMDRHTPRLVVLALVTSLLVQTLGCSTPADATPSDDAGPALDASADAASIVDAGDRTDIGRDRDGGFFDDAGSTIDAGSWTDAGPTLVDAGFSATDAGPSSPPDLGPLADAGCVADVFESNDTPETAAVAAIGAGWPETSYPMTWSDADTADWISAGPGTVGFAGGVRVFAWESDADSVVEVRVTCSGGLVSCTGGSGGGVTRSGATCIGRHVFAVSVDVGCMTSPATVSVRVGAIRALTRTTCGHAIGVRLTPA